MNFRYNLFWEIFLLSSSLTMMTGFRCTLFHYDWFFPRSRKYILKEIYSNSKTGTIHTIKYFNTIRPFISAQKAWIKLWIFIKRWTRKKSWSCTATTFSVISNKTLKLQAKGDTKLHSLKCRGIPIPRNSQPVFILKI